MEQEPKQKPDDVREVNVIGGPGRKIRTKPEPTMTLKDETKATVMLALLEQNREEIRFWHEKMFQAAFALDSALLVVGAFVLHDERQDKMLVWIAIAACVLFAVFHQIVGRIGAGAIRINARDLEFIQATLRLNESGEFEKNNPIYTWTGTEWIPQQHFRFLHILNLSLAGGLIAVLIYRLLNFTN
jgi:hypothetical protein